MASYFVASHPLPDGGHAVHDRSRCPPSCFPDASAEYLGEFSDRAQAIVVARVRYAVVRGCPCCDVELAPAAPPQARPLTSLRS